MQFIVGIHKWLAVVFDKIFRRDAVAQRHQTEPLDARLQVTAPHEWLLLSALGLLLAAFVCWALIARVERSLSVPATLLEPGQRHAVQAPLSGNVVELMAEIGDAVAPGQAIARLQPDPELIPDADARRLIELLEARGAGTEAAPRGRPSGGEGSLVVSAHGGRLASHRLELGKRVAAGSPIAQIRTGNAGPWQALAFVTPADAGRFRPGMHAQVRIAPPGSGAALSFHGEISEVSARPVAPRRWLSGFALSVPKRAHLVRMSLHRDQKPPVADGERVLMRVVLDRVSPMALLVSGGG